jgi:hypothetical protein
MSEQRSPWARPGGVDTSPAVVTYPQPVDPRTPVDPRSAARPAEPVFDLGPGWSRSGTVTQLGSAPPQAPADAPERPRDAQRRTLLWFGGGAGVILVIGVIILLALAMTGNGPLVANNRAPGPGDYAPPLAKACPPPSADAQHLPPAPPPPPGPRTVDRQTGISYAEQGSPWVPWDAVWSAGDLHVRYGVGQHFITEYYSGGSYHASILSGSVPTAENDALTLDLKCTGHQVLADVRASYYPQPNTIEPMRDEVTTLGGRPAWVAKFRLHFHASGLKAQSELVGIALLDVGRPNAAILYISIPDTHRQYDDLVDLELNSVRPT